MNRYIAIGLLILLLSFNMYSQIPLKKDTVEKLLVESPAFTIFNDNFFITGTTLSETPSKYNSDVKYQLSFKQRLMNKPTWFGFYPYLAYTQKSFWDIYLKSSPFAESNYNPGLFLTKPFFKNSYLNGSFILSLEHESNGRSEDNGSKSWNYIAGNYSIAITSGFITSLKIWFPFGLSDNSDLLKYIGYGEASLHWIVKENKLTMDAVLRKGSSFDWKGSIQLDIQYRPFKSRNQYLMLQWYNGYAESLIDYNQKQNMLRLGLVLRPTFYRFY